MDDKRIIKYFARLISNTYDNACAAGGFASSSRSQFLYLWLSVIRKKFLTTCTPSALVNSDAISSLEPSSD